MPIVSAYALYNGTTSTYVGDENATVQINCERVQAFSPRQVFLKRTLAPGQGAYIIYTVTFDGDDPEIDQNTIQGYWIEVDGKDVMIDAASASAFLTACDSCCDDQPITVTRFYTSGVYAFVTPTTTNYCITRTDAGTVAAHEAVSTDYLTQYVGNVRLVSANGTTSKYQVASFVRPKPIGTDYIAQGTC